MTAPDQLPFGNNDVPATLLFAIQAGLLAIIFLTLFLVYTYA